MLSQKKNIVRFICVFLALIILCSTSLSAFAETTTQYIYVTHDKFTFSRARIYDSATLDSWGSYTTINSVGGMISDVFTGYQFIGFQCGATSYKLQGKTVYLRCNLAEQYPILKKGTYEVSIPLVFWNLYNENHINVSMIKPEFTDGSNYIHGSDEINVTLTPVTLNTTDERKYASLGTITCQVEVTNDLTPTFFDFGFKISSSFTFEQTNNLGLWDDITITKILPSDEEQALQTEKNEADQSGNDAIDDVSGAIPNDNQGVINALTNFAGALIYDGTECAWTMPEVAIPEIAGVIPKTVLIQEQPIDFKKFVDLIPLKIMTLVKALTTVVLIIYCGKEIYGWIDYAMTKKKEAGA